MKYIIWALVVVLLLVHQDNWFWTDATLVFGFIPIGLLWHAGISICAVMVWYLATIYAWPSHLEYVEEPSTDGEAE
ncbi:MAG: DUF3311 domain-containing protein [Pirellulaceae bacterium]|nr:DUF3311 domain-containing protein [Pirellulaceae bacterium]